MGLFAPPVVPGSSGYGDWPTDQWGKDIYQDQPGAAWQFLLDKLLGRQDSTNQQQQFYQKQQQTYWDRYVASYLNGGPQYFSDYLQSVAPEVQGLWDNASSEEKGIRPGGGIGRMRWVGFPG